jgi:hypothetical protein
MTSLSKPPKRTLAVLFFCFDFKKSNSTLPNSILYTLGFSIIKYKRNPFFKRQKSLTQSFSFNFEKEND